MRRIQWRNVLRRIQRRNVVRWIKWRDALRWIKWRNVLRWIKWRNVLRRCLAFLLALSCLLQQAIAQEASPLPTFEELEAEGAIIGEIRINNQNIFNLDDPRENNALYRAANKLHIRTRLAALEPWKAHPELIVCPIVDVI